VKRIALVVGFATLAACGAENGNQLVDGNTAADATQGCSITLVFNPVSPIADPVAKIRVAAQLSGISGVPDYQWTVLYSGNSVPATPASVDNSQIDFVAPDAGTYSVTVSVTGAVSCPASTTQAVIVHAPGANVADYRLRTRPAAGDAPPQETILQVIGGTPIDRPIALDPGLLCNGTISDGTAGIPAYLRFMPAGNPDASVETFAGASGGFSVRLLGQMHDVLVVPAVANVAPRKLSYMPCGGSIVLPAGTPVTGTVRDPANAALGGAKVRISIDGVPSTLATTAADGSFTLHAATVAGATVDVEVTPPPARGLPILRSSGVIDTSQPLAIRYAATNTTCDLAGTRVQRAGVDLPGAKVAIVGTRNAAGTAAATTAAGEIRIASVADGTGRLPALLVPRAPVQVVVSLSATDVAVVPLDLSACAASIISAPAVVHRTGTVKDVTPAALSGVQIEAVPVGPLALASAVPIQVRTGGTGMFDLPLASGGLYDVRFGDPLARGAQLVLTNLSPAQVPTQVTLPKAIAVSGKVSILGNPNPVVGASIQMLCATCTGLAAERPVGEAATDDASLYRVAVPDPGTM
jgi:hypothetical protein